MNRPALGPTQLPIARVSGVLPPGVKWPGNETDHSFLLSVKFEWNYASSPSLCLFSLTMPLLPHYASSPSLCLHGIYRDAFTFCHENFPSVRHVCYVHMVCWTILFLPHVAESVDTVISLLLFVVGVVVEVIAVLLRVGEVIAVLLRSGEVITVLLRGGAGVFMGLVLLVVVVLMTVVITVVVVLVKATFCVAWNIVKIWAFHTFEEDV